jgi:hypothetical protein
MRSSKKRKITAWPMIELVDSKRGNAKMSEEQKTSDEVANIIKPRDPREVKENDIETQMYLGEKRGFFYEYRINRIPESEVFKDEKHDGYEITGSGISKLVFLGLNGSNMTVYVAAKKEVGADGKEGEATAFRRYVFEDGHGSKITIDGDESSFSDIKAVTQMFAGRKDGFLASVDYLKQNKAKGFSVEEKEKKE